MGKIAGEIDVDAPVTCRCQQRERGIVAGGADPDFTGCKNPLETVRERFDFGECLEQREASFAGQTREVDDLQEARLPQR